MKSRHLLSLAAFVGASLVAPLTSQAADSTGSVGYVESVLTYSSSSDTYASRRGEVVIREGSTDQSPTQIYIFGGSTCNQRTISNSQINALIQLINDSNRAVQPKYKPGLAGVRCIVGFKASKPPAAQSR